MKRFILASAVAGVLVASPAFAKRDPDVDKALKRQYPDAQTQIINTADINGVKVNHVKVTTKDGESEADVTEYGDFLRYGIPRSSKDPLINVLQQNTGGLFKSAPQDVDMYRVTDYVVELQGPSNKTYQARFDAVGRLQDLTSHRALTQEEQAETQQKATGAEAQAAEKYAKGYFPDIQIEGVYQSNVGPGFYNVKTKDGNVLVSSGGRVYSMREKVEASDIPKPVQEGIDALFNKEKIQRVDRSEWQYYQFDETTQSGHPVTVWMRPNGDIIKVLTPASEQEQQPTLATHKETASKKNKKKAE